MIQEMAKVVEDDKKDMSDSESSDASKAAGSSRRIQEPEVSDV